MDAPQDGDVLHVSAETVKRDWKLAKAWLQRELKSGGAPSGTREARAARSLQS